MSQLQKACDHVLKSTRLLSHEYGVPPLEPAAVDAADDDLLLLEALYCEMYRTLVDKLNHLLYVNRLKELAEMPDDKINELYEETIAPQLLQSHDTALVESHYRSHIAFKTDTVLNTHLATVVPVLRAIHHDEAAVTPTERNLLVNLKQLFSDTGKASTSRLMQGTSANDAALSGYASLHQQLHELIAHDVAPKLRQFHQLSSTLESHKKSLVSLRREAVSDDDVAQLRDTAAQLVHRWTRIAVYCDLVPNLVMCNPTNWYEDEKLREAIEECSAYAEDARRWIKAVGDVDAVMALDFPSSAP